MVEVAEVFLRFSRSVLMAGMAYAALATGATPGSDSDLVSALSAMIRAADAGDQAGLMDCFVFTDPAVQKAAEVLLGQVAGEQRLYAASAKVFKDASVPENDALQALRESLATAQVAINGEQALVTTKAGQTYFLVRRNGKWKIDFDRTQAAMGALPDPEKLDAIRRQTAAMDQFTDELLHQRDPKLDLATLAVRIAAIEQMVPEPIIGPPRAPVTQTRPASATGPATRP